MHDEIYDIAIIGAGMVGASIAYSASPYCKVLLLEAEAAAGYHSTGRSAAVYTESYGPPGVRALTRASWDFLNTPPAGFAAERLLKPRGAMFVGREDQKSNVRQRFEELSGEGGRVKLLGAAEVREKIPVLKQDAANLGVLDERALDIDVDLLLQGFLKGARAQGADYRRNERVRGLRRDEKSWRIDTEAGSVFRTEVLVNCAGAWADSVAEIAGVPTVGIEPRRRSAFLFNPPPDVPCHDWPVVADIDDTWYFKPDAGLLLGSPANADLVQPHDVVAEDIDIALGIHRIEEATTLKISRPTSTWAGLRSFVADGEPVCGFDESRPGFFWAAALGGYGIQTASAFGRLCSALLRGEDVPADIESQGLGKDSLSPMR